MKRFGAMDGLLSLGALSRDGRLLSHEALWRKGFTGSVMKRFGAMDWLGR